MGIFQVVHFSMWSIVYLKLAWLLWGRPDFELNLHLAQWKMNNVTRTYLIFNLKWRWVEEEHMRT
jgi:1-acyl-sn-glycerol-3-phosphate acyltransferase